MRFSLNRFTRILLSFLFIYIVWSAFVDLTNLDHKIDNEALLPCLFYLPPAGFLGIGIILVKVIQSAIFVRWVKRVAHRFRKK